MTEENNLEEMSKKIIAEAVAKGSDDLVFTSSSSRLLSDYYGRSKPKPKKIALRMNCSGETDDLWYYKSKVYLGRKDRPKERKRIERMVICNVQCRSSRSLKKHREKIPHYRRNQKPTFLERLLGRKEFSRRQDD